MKTHLYLLALGLLGSFPAPARQPLTLVQTIEMPEVPAGPYADHMALDLEGRRLFTTPQANKAIDVLDLTTGKVLRTIRGFGNPHAILYRGDRNRLFVTDGDGALRIFDATSYREIKSIKLEPDADGIGYDARTGYLYVSNGGAEAGKEYSLISIIDTAREAKIGDVRVGAPGLEAMVIDQTSDRLYINLPEKNAIAVIDLEKRVVIATWPVTMGKRNEAFALDAEQHWLYVGCNDSDVRGSIVVIDTRNGKEMQRLPIGSWVDSMFYDSRRRRIYASTGVGEVFTYERQSDGSHRALEPVDTAVMARTALFSAELDRLFVTVPHLGWTTAKVLVFKPE
jgi:DNA-binding beta-propeller fold protein YncE